MNDKPFHDIRIFVDDVNSRKIGTFEQTNYSIRNVGFDEGQPIYRSNEPIYVGLTFSVELGNINFAFPAVIDIFEKRIDNAISYLQTIKKSLSKEPVLESEINPPEEKINISVLASIERDFYEANKEFKTDGVNNIQK